MDQTVEFPATWNAPPELTRERPRSVRLTGTGIFLTIVSTVMAVAALPTVLAMRASDASADARALSLRADGRDVEANVTRLRRTGKNKRESRVAYAFVVDNARYEAEVEAPLAVWSDLQVGSHLSVRYLTRDPAINHPNAWDSSRVGLAPVVIVPLMLVGIGGLLWFVRRRDRRLLENGVPVPGVVTRSHRVKGGYTAHYQFRTDDGEVRRGRGAVSRRCQAGEMLCVVVDPDNPRRNTPYPLKTYRVHEAG